MSKEKFRLRGPSRSIENPEIPAGKQADAWLEALNFLKSIKIQRVHSFKFQVNLIREPRAAEEHKR